MAEPVPAGSDASAGTYSCTNCGYKLEVDSTRHLPPCPECGNGEWHTITGGDSIHDPSPTADNGLPPVINTARAAGAEIVADDEVKATQHKGSSMAHARGPIRLAPSAPLGSRQRARADEQPDPRSRRF